MSIFNKLSSSCGILSNSVEKTQQIALQVAKELPTNCSVGFHGDLGTGKTTFIAGMVKAWGINEPVKSPSYNIMNVYQGHRQIVHMDAYRLESANALESLMIEDILENPWVILVEWPENIDNDLPDPYFQFYMSLENQNHRIRMNLPK